MIDAAQESGKIFKYGRKEYRINIMFLSIRISFEDINHYF
jgi:hypothetical protein